jgi:hypothetical protein
MSNWSANAGGVLSACLAAFGQSITYESLPDAPVALRAILGSQVQREDALPGRYARIYICLTDLPAAPVRGAKVNIAATTYNVVEIEADGNGGAYLTLHNPDFNG